MTDVTDQVGTTVKAGAKAGKNVPPMVWGIAVVGGLAVAYFMNKSKSTAAANTTGTSPTAMVYTGDGNATGTTTTDTTTGQFQTNDAWAAAAKNWLIAQGSDAKAASDAIDLYINGQALNQQQNAMVAAAIRGIGAPPTNLPPVTGTPSQSNTGDLSQFATSHVNYQDTQSNTASHLAGAVYTVQQGDTIDSIARKAYNFSSNTAYSNLTFAMDEIINANFQKIPDAKNLTPGTQLYIPLLASEMFPNYGSQVPLLGFQSGQTAGEWEFTAGLVPQSAAVNRPSTGR